MPIVDASVAAKWLLPEHDSEAALRVLEAESCVAPDFAAIEVRNVILSRLRRGLLSQHDALTFEQNLQRLPFSLFPTQPLLADAFFLATEMAYPIYDCIYLAAAIHREDIVITADDRFLNVVASSPHRERLRSLAEFRPR
jgi:predicted nucleic acid-binding protein